jgi:hypothetical protein
MANDPKEIIVISLQDLVDPVNQLDVRVAAHLAEECGSLD